MPIQWKDYVGLRNMDEKKYFLDHKITNYQELLARIDKKDVCPPTESEVAGLFYQPKEIVSKASKKSSTSTQKVDISKRSTSRRRKTSTRKKPSTKN